MSLVYMSNCHPVALFLLLLTCQPLNPAMGFLHACAWCWRTQARQPCEYDWPESWDSAIKISGHYSYFFPLKSQNFSPVWHAPPPQSGFLFSSLVPKWAALTLTLCTQHCVPVSDLHVPRHIFTPTCFTTVFQVVSCLMQLLTARTVMSLGTY